MTPTHRSPIAELPVFTTFSLSGIKRVPEPGTLLLLGAGVAGLALVGRRRKEWPNPQDRRSRTAGQTIQAAIPSRGVAAFLRPASRLPS